jgi:hypothetical protein
MANRIGRENKNTGSSRYYRSAWTTTPALYDILAAAPGDDTNHGFALACRKITIGTAGTLVLTDLDGNSQTLTLPVGIHEIQATSLAATSTAQGVSVLW